MSNSYGQFWYGGQIGFPGFLYKKNVGVGGRRSTKFAAGGNRITNTPQNIYNKYQAGNSGVGASSIATRRAKNRLATICKENNCFPCYNTLGQYSKYTHNPNGYVPCIVPFKQNICYYQPNSPWATFRGTNTNYYGRSLFNILNTTPTNITQGSDSIYFDQSPVIDEDGYIYGCSYNNPYLYCFNPDCTIKWIFYTNSSISIGCRFNNPIIGCDGTIYFGCDMFNPENNPSSVVSKLFAINPDGTKKWDVFLNGSVDDAMTIIGNYGNILTTTSTGNIYLIDLDGQIIKLFETEQQNLNGWNSSIDVQSNLFFTNSPEYLFIINLNNKTMKKVPLNINSLYIIPVVIGDYVYQTTEEGIIYKINKYTGIINKQSSTIIGEYGNTYNNSPIVDKNQNIYIGTNTGNFIKFDKNLNIMWIYNVTGGSFDYGSAVLSNNNLIILNDANNANLICIDVDKNFKWSISYDSKSYSTPAISSNGTIYMFNPNGIKSYN